MRENNVIRDKSKAFAVRILKFSRYLNDEKKENVLAKQILRSGTSIGANVRESARAQSEADFYSKLNIALKEADETSYWLEIIYEANIIDQKQFSSLYDECEEIISILTAITKNQKY